MTQPTPGAAKAEAVYVVTYTHEERAHLRAVLTQRLAKLQDRVRLGGIPAAEIFQSEIARLTFTLAKLATATPDAGTGVDVGRLREALKHYQEAIPSMWVTGNEWREEEPDWSDEDRAEWTDVGGMARAALAAAGDDAAGWPEMGGG